MLKMSLSAGKKDMSLSQINATSQRHSPEAAYVLGVRVDRLSQRQALDSIEQIITQWRASDRAQVCQQIVTVNPEFVMNAQRNKDFRTAINAAALIVADGGGNRGWRRLRFSLGTSTASAGISAQVGPGMALPALS